MKKILLHGVLMTPGQEIKFSKYLQKPNVPAMNTLTKEQRTAFVKNWINTELISRILIQEMQ